MTPIERLQTSLTTLGLKAVEARLENLLEQAAQKRARLCRVLDELLGCEVDARRTRYLRARLQLAHFPFAKTFEQFGFGFQPSIDEKQIRELRTLRFVHEASNVILLGPPGVGKDALERGAGRSRDSERIRSVLHDRARSGDRSGPRVSRGPAGSPCASLPGAQSLIIDEMGYLPLNDLGATIFFQLVSARYERGGIILTSNKSYGDWGSIFGDPHHRNGDTRPAAAPSTTINIRGESYRLKDRRKAGLFPRPEEKPDQPLSLLTNVSEQSSPSRGPPRAGQRARGRFQAVLGTLPNN